VNQRQHDTLREVEHWKGEVSKRELQLFEAKTQLAGARRSHAQAVNADRASWEAR
jgi:hypothetical protein